MTRKSHLKSLPGGWARGRPGRGHSTGYRLIKRNMPRLLPFQVASLCLALVTIVLSLVLVHQTRRLVDGLPGRLNPGLFVPLIVAAAAYFVITLVFEFVFRRTQIVGRNEITVLLFDRMQYQPVEYFQNRDSGEIMP